MCVPLGTIAQLALNLAHRTLPTYPPPKRQVLALLHLPAPATHAPIQQDGQTPLWLSCTKDHATCVRALIAAGANKEALWVSTGSSLQARPAAHTHTHTHTHATNVYKCVYALPSIYSCMTGSCVDCFHKRPCLSPHAILSPGWPDAAAVGRRERQCGGADGAHQGGLQQGGPRQGGVGLGCVRLAVPGGVWDRI